MKTRLRLGKTSLDSGTVLVCETRSRIVRAMLTALLIAGLPGTGCSTLVHTELKETMSVQGSYQCEAKPDVALKETPAEADVSRVRCYQDQWQNFGEEIVFTRTLYQTYHCQTPLGRVVYRQTANPAGGAPSSKASCKLIRLNPGWIAEEKGRCRLNDIKPLYPSSLKPLLQCSSHLPTFCFESQPEVNFVPVENSVNPDEFRTANAVTVTASNHYSASCKRYLE